jgi:hypothetical protein
MKSDQECVILIHGLAAHSCLMGKMEKALRGAGYLTENLDYPSRKHTIPVLAEKFVGKAVCRCRNRSNGQIHFLTHSMGGIMVRHYLSCNIVSSPGRVVMLAPPNHGSEIVDRLIGNLWFRWLLGPAGCSLGTGQKGIIHQLGEVDYSLGIITGNQSFDFLCSWMLPRPNDGKVSLDSAKLKGMDDFLIVPYGHSFIMRKRKVIEEVIYFLKKVDLGGGNL